MTAGRSAPGDGPLLPFPMSPRRRSSRPVGRPSALALILAAERHVAGVRFAAPVPLPPWWPFTLAETRVAELLPSRHTHDEIAQLLSVSPKTVATHVAHIGAKLPGVGPPAERCGAFMAGVALWLMRNPDASGDQAPAALLRDRAPSKSTSGKSPGATAMRSRPRS